MTTTTTRWAAGCALWALISRCGPSHWSLTPEIRRRPGGNLLYVFRFR